jgi:hypothetical protein
MITQPSDNDTAQTSQTPHWTDAELRRVSRVFELLIRIDKRIKKGQVNENDNTKSEQEQKDA